MVGRLQVEVSKVFVFPTFQNESVFFFFPHHQLMMLEKKHDEIQMLEEKQHDENFAPEIGPA